MESQDYIENYRELVRSGSSVEDKMIDYVEDLIQEIIDENFPEATIGPIQPTSEITFFSREEAACTINPDIDSVDEELDRDNNPFYPPICLRSALSLSSIQQISAWTPIPECGPNDAGINANGKRVISNFTTVASSGHYLEYVMIPPSFATVSSLIP